MAYRIFRCSLPLGMLSKHLDVWMAAQRCGDDQWVYTVVQNLQGNFHVQPLAHRTDAGIAERISEAKIQNFLVLSSQVSMLKALLVERGVCQWGQIIDGFLPS